MKRTNVYGLAPLLLSLILAGCASYSGIHTESSKLEADALGAKDITAEWPKTDWWLALNDATLNGLIAQALHDNPDVQRADARLRQAHAIAGVAESATYPQVDATFSTTRQRFSENGLVPPPYAGSTYNVNELNLGGNWEIDFFGRNREALKAALGELRATEAEHQAARIMIATEVANNYFALARLQQQLQIADQLNRQRADKLGLEVQRVAAGITGAGDLEPLKGNVSETHRDTEALKEQIALERHAIAALLGRGPDATANLNAALPNGEVLALPQEIPLALLGHRADIVAARWRVESGLHGIESAKAAFYPNVNLRGFFGFSAVGFDNFLNAGNRTPGVGLAVSLPIFDAGRLRSEYRFVNAQTDGAIVNYNKTLVSAFRDVADQISTMDSIDKQLQKQQAVLSHAEQSYALAQQRYAAGITGRLPVLDAEAAVLSQRRALIDLQARWSIARVQLIHALGGGFAENADAHHEQAQSNNGGHHG
jgi:NodT family efflux transporter outer membrane factor (OMF) lipoprotein